MRLPTMTSKILLHTACQHVSTQLIHYSFSIKISITEDTDANLVTILLHEDYKTPNYVHTSRVAHQS